MLVQGGSRHDQLTYSSFLPLIVAQHFCTSIVIAQLSCSSLHKLTHNNGFNYFHFATNTPTFFHINHYNYHSSLTTQHTPLTTSSHDAFSCTALHAAQSSGTHARQHGKEARQEQQREQ